MARQGLSKRVQRGLKPKGVWFNLLPFQPPFKPNPLEHPRGGETKNDPNKFGFHSLPPLLKTKEVGFKRPLKPKSGWFKLDLNGRG